MAKRKCHGLRHFSPYREHTYGKVRLLGRVCRFHQHNAKIIPTSGVHTFRTHLATGFRLAHAQSRLACPDPTGFRLVQSDRARLKARLRVRIQPASSTLGRPLPRPRRLAGINAGAKGSQMWCVKPPNVEKTACRAQRQSGDHSHTKRELSGVRSLELEMRGLTDLVLKFIT